jgi:hypothetical protein
MEIWAIEVFLLRLYIPGAGAGGWISDVSHVFGCDRVRFEDYES